MRFTAFTGLRTAAQLAYSRPAPRQQLRMAHGLTNSALWREQAYINGEWVSAASGDSFEVTNPATGDVLGTVPTMSSADADRAVEAAFAAWPSWRSSSIKKRESVLKKWASLIRENSHDVARIMTLECGKPLAESRCVLCIALGIHA
jgi:succinate-semialdehyde dehydrogenase / glutarate-semialdehyde dehydrogenase